MSIHVDPRSLTRGRQRYLRVSLPMPTATGPRAALEAFIEELIGILDRIDPDPDLEDTGDDEFTGDAEPSLGSPDRMMNQEHACAEAAWHLGVDRELDTCDDEDGHDDELEAHSWANPLGAKVDDRMRLIVEKVPDRQVRP